jgi:hypothetical protein
MRSHRGPIAARASSSSRLRPHAVEHRRHLGKPGAVRLIELNACPLANVCAQEPMTANGGQDTGQGQAAIVENDQRAGRVGASGERVIDRDTEHPFWRAGVAVTGVPQADGQVRPAVHVRSPALGQGCGGGELIEELL